MSSPVTEMASDHISEPEVEDYVAPGTPAAAGSFAAVADVDMATPSPMKSATDFLGHSPAVVKHPATDLNPPEASCTVPHGLLHNMIATIQLSVLESSMRERMQACLRWRQPLISG